MSRLAGYYTFMDQGDSAIAWAERARATDSLDGKYRMDLAAYYVQYDRLDQASAILRSLPKAPKDRTNSDLAKIMSQLAARYSRVGNDSATVVWATAAWRRNPLHLRYTYDLANFYMQTNRPRKALEMLRTIPPDSVSADALTRVALAEGATFGPDSAMRYLIEAKALAPNSRYVDSLIRKFASYSLP